jgi:spore coat polysaccharide biosynthesis protein SpsF
MEKRLRVVAIIQGRMGSTRLPGKILKPILGRPLLSHIVERVRKAKTVDEVIIATSINPLDDPVEEFAKKEGIKYYRGKEADLIDRFYNACVKFNIDVIVRVTADCPFVDPQLIDKLVNIYLNNRDKYDLISNIHPPTFPDGLDLEIIPFSVMKEIHFGLKNKFDREWFTTYLFDKGKYQYYNLENDEDLSLLRWTIDYPEDYEFFKRVFSELYNPKKIFLQKDILNFLKKNPDIAKINEKYTDRFHGYKKAIDEFETEKMKVLVIGCGAIGERHVKNLLEFGNVKVIACDCDKEKLKRIDGAKTYEDIDQAIEKEKPEYVVIATAHASHIEIANKVLGSVKKIFIEKPISHSLEGVDAFLSKAKEKGVEIYVGYNMRFNPLINKIKELIDEWGDISHVRMNFGSNLILRHPGKDYKNDYVTKKNQGGGVILDISHEIDYLTWIFGQPKEMFCYAEKRGNFEMETEDNADMLIKFDGGLVANIHLDLLQKPYTRTCEIIGEKGTIKADVAKNELFIYEDNKWEKIVIDDDNSYVDEMTEFLSLESIKKKKLPDGESAKNTLKIALSAKESSKTGKIIKWK